MGGEALWAMLAAIGSAVSEAALPIAIVASSAMQLAAQSETPSGPIEPIGTAPTPTLTPRDIPTRESESVKEARRDFLFKEGQRRGQVANILTGPQGLQSEPVLGQAQLLGVGR
jgi:hypothetical protein